MKKKILSATLTMTMVLALTACGSSASSEDNSGGGEGGKDGATIQVIPMSTASAYWLAVSRGRSSRFKRGVWRDYDQI